MPKYSLKRIWRESENGVEIYSFREPPIVELVSKNEEGWEGWYFYKITWNGKIICDIDVDGLADGFKDRYENNGLFRQGREITKKDLEGDFRVRYSFLHLWFHCNKMGIDCGIDFVEEKKSNGEYILVDMYEEIVEDVAYSC